MDNHRELSGGRRSFLARLTAGIGGVGGGLIAVNRAQERGYTLATV